MSRPPVVFLLWGLFLALVAAVEWAIFTHHTPNYYLLVLLPVFAIGGTVALAALAAARPRRQEARERVNIVVELSMPSALIGVAVAVMLWGSFIGEWLLLIGAGLLVLGVGGVSREVVCARRLHRAASLGESERSGGT
jgi:peptidoglycan/LPS O-acetylase OafA/YrhL